MDRNIYKFIFKHTKGQQLYILLVTLCSMPFYYASLDIPKLIINSALKVDDPSVSGDEFPRPLKILGIEIMDVDQVGFLSRMPTTPSDINQSLRKLYARRFLRDAPLQC